MLERKKLEIWEETYWNHIKRNIGLIKFKEQEKIRQCKIAVLGLGGLGGPLAEQLVRCGCENLVICDNDHFESSNLNRQICTREDIGKPKTQVVKDFLIKINRNLNIKKYSDLNINNIAEVLKDVKIVALTLDDPFTSILVTRKCRSYAIPIIESYGIPYLFAWWFTKDNISYENFYDFDASDKSMKYLYRSKELKGELKNRMLNKLLKFPEIRDLYSREDGILKALFSGNLSSINLAPLVRLNASYLAFDIVYSGVLNIKRKILAPNVLGYDYFHMTPINFTI